MKAEYDLSKMKSRRDPYASRLKKSVTMRLFDDVLTISSAWPLTLVFRTRASSTSTPGTLLRIIAKCRLRGHPSPEHRIEGNAVQNDMRAEYRRKVAHVLPS